MLDRLPAEVLHRCLDRLTLKQKVRCLYVNKSWNHQIRSTYFLYETIQIKGRGQFDEMQDFFKKHKEDGKKVKHLYLYRCALRSLKRYVSLPTLFPNIKTFHMEELTNDCLNSTNWDIKAVQELFKPWKETIEEIVELGSPICTHAILSRTPCKTLHSLRLAMKGPCKYYGDAYKYITKLRYAPNLTKLQLQLVNFSMTQFEKLLTTAPNLKILTCTSVNFRCDLHYDLTNITPCSLKTFVLERCSYNSNDYNIAHWLTYFGVKLIHVKNFVHNFIPDSIPVGFRADIGDELAWFLSNTTEMEYLRTHAFKLDSRAFEAMDQGGVKLKKLDMGGRATIVQEETDLLLMYKALFQSKQKDSLESLSSYSKPFSVLQQELGEEGIDFLEELAKFPNLKHLRILQETKFSMGGPIPNEVPLNTLLRMLPNLETLEMDYGDLMIDESIPSTKLKRLYLEYFDIHASKEDITKSSEEYLKNDVLPNTKVIIRTQGERHIIDQDGYRYLLVEDV